MEFLILLVVVAIASYIGYAYYKTKVVAPEPTDVLVLTEEVKAEVAPVEVKVEPKKASKAPAKKTTTKKKPALKVEK